MSEDFNHKKMVDTMVEKLGVPKVSQLLELSDRSVRNYMEGKKLSREAKEKVSEGFRKWMTRVGQPDEEQEVNKEDLRDTVIALQAELLSIKNGKTKPLEERLLAIESGLRELKETVEVNRGLIHAMAREMFPGPSFDKKLEGMTLVYPKKGEKSTGK